MCVCVRACVRACVRLFVRACVRVCHVFGVPCVYYRPPIALNKPTFGMVTCLHVSELNTRWPTRVVRSSPSYCIKGKTRLKCRHVRLCACVRACVRVCVRERERDRDRGRDRQTDRQTDRQRERARERERERERERKRVKYVK